jgi:photosystem II stability/assembly factor-like uncharacterized protein
VVGWNERLADWHLVFDGFVIGSGFGAGGRVWLRTRDDVYISSDFGAHWRALNLGQLMSNGVVEAFAITDRNDMWAGIRINNDEWRRSQYGQGPNHAIRYNPGLGLFVSKDDGEHWKRNGWRASDAYIRQIVFYDVDHGIVRTEAKTYWTANEGISWAPSEFVDRDRTLSVADIVRDGTSFLATRSTDMILGYQDGHLFSSRDGGSHWEVIHTRTPIDFFETACFTSISNGAGLMTATGIVYVTNDGGKEWRRVPELSKSVSLACGVFGDIYAIQDNTIIKLTLR